MARRPKGVTVRRVNKNEERRRPGLFITLKDQEKLVGYPLFEPDAELKSNPGYFEYYSHYDPSGPATVPCLGEDCLMCERGDNPSTRALTLWYFPDAPKAEQLKVFTANAGTIEDMVDEAEDLGGILGRKYRVKRRGSGQKTRYRLTNMNSTLPKKESAAILKGMEIDLEELIQKQAIKQYERLKAIEALDEDDDLEEVEDEDDEDEEETPTKKSKRGKPVDEDDDDEEDEEDEEEDEDEDEDDDEESPDPIESVEFELLSVSKKNNTAKVEHDGDEIVIHGDDENGFDEFKKGDTVTISAEWDDEEEQWTASAVEQAEEDEEAEDESEEDEEDEDEDEAEEDDEDEDDEETEIEGLSVTVVSTNEDEELMTVKALKKDSDLGEFDLYLPDGIELEFDDVPKGTKLVIAAAKDDEGDWVLTEEPEIEKKKSTRKTTRRKK